MKKVLFKRRIDLVKGKKNFEIFSRSEDKKCRTQVRKSFTYVVDTVNGNEIEHKPRDPLVFIRKTFDTKKRVEEFGFHVKGYFYISHNDVFMKVLFHHTLDIKIRWKIKDFSPKKSASLT